MGRAVEGSVRRKKQYDCVSDLKEASTDAWDKLTSVFLCKLVASMSNSFIKLLKVGGGTTGTSAEPFSISSLSINIVACEVGRLITFFSSLLLVLAAFWLYCVLSKKFCFCLQHYAFYE